VPFNILGIFNPDAIRNRDAATALSITAPRRSLSRNILHDFTNISVKKLLKACLDMEAYQKPAFYRFPFAIYQEGR
jgi:hypothetical protein